MKRYLVQYNVTNGQEEAKVELMTAEEIVKLLKEDYDGDFLTGLCIWDVSIMGTFKKVEAYEFWEPEAYRRIRLM